MQGYAEFNVNGCLLELCGVWWEVDKDMKHRSSTIREVREGPVLVPNAVAVLPNALFCEFPSVKADQNHADVTDLRRIS